MLNALPILPLGETGLDVSALALGTVKFGRNTGVKYPTGFSLPEDRDIEQLLAFAQDAGINYIDTAPAYGTSEQRLGEILGKNTRQWIISTKIGEYFDAGVSHYDFSSDGIKASVERSLSLLNRDTLDIVFVHSNGDDRAVIEATSALDTLNQLKAEGVIRAVGYSGKQAEETCLAIDRVDVFMVTLNQEDTSQLPLIKLCHQHNKGVVIKKALASGHTENSAAALRYVSQTAGVHSTIVGTINLKHLAANVQALLDAA